jgi:hypothetical protein
MNRSAEALLSGEERGNGSAWHMGFMGSKRE